MIENKEHPTAFVSYSWDSKKHQKWVKDLVNDLRKNYGIDATMDVFETQNRTVNLNEMMIFKFKESDYVILILTKNYAQKADNFEGGVGFETLLTIPEIKDNPDKVILAVKHSGDFSEAIPYYLRDFYVINFSDDKKYEEKLYELSCRIFDFNFQEKASLGEIPDLDKLKSKKLLNKNTSLDILDKINYDKKSNITDLDKEEFMKESYNALVDSLIIILNNIQDKDSKFYYKIQKVTEEKVIFKFYRDGKFTKGIKIWLGSLGSSSNPNINLSNSIDPTNDNSMNEIIRCEVNDNKLTWKMDMNFLGNKKPENLNDLTLEIWENHIKPYI